MAAVDLSTVSSFPHIKVISTVGTTQQEVNLPSGKVRISIGGNAALYLATSSVVDGDPMPTDKVTIPADNLLELDLGHSSNDKIDKVAIAAQTGTADVEIILERI